MTSAVLEEVLHDGLSRPRPGLVERVSAAVEALAAAGLEGARTRLATFLRERTLAHWLDVALRVELTREAIGASGPEQACDGARRRRDMRAATLAENALGDIFGIEMDGGSGSQTGRPFSEVR